MTERNFEFALLNAVNNDQNTEQWLQIADSEMTSNDANIESTCYNQWNSALKVIASVVNMFAAEATNTTFKNDLTEAQQQYQVASTTAQTTETQMDGATQSAQQSVGQDGTNLQNQAQLAQTLTSIGSQVANMISHAYS
jgi:hypothetical protein